MLDNVIDIIFHCLESKSMSESTYTPRILIDLVAYLTILIIYVY